MGDRSRALENGHGGREVFEFKLRGGFLSEARLWVAGRWQAEEETGSNFRQGSRGRESRLEVTGGDGKRGCVHGKFEPRAEGENCRKSPL